MSFIFFSFFTKENNLKIHGYKNLLIEGHDIFIDQQLSQNHYCNNLLILGDIILPEDYTNVTNTNIASYIFEQYSKKGVNFLRKLDGKFTLLILLKNKIIIFRDRAGSGPTIYYNNHHLTTHLSLFKEIYNDLQINDDSIDEFLRFGHIQSPNTIYSGIQKIAGGQLLEVHRNGSNKILQLYPIEDFIAAEGNIKISEEDAIKELHMLHKKTLRKRIKNFSKIGVLISGGFDSGGNLFHISNGYSHQNITAISIGFKNHQLSEVAHAKLMADTFKTDFQTYNMDGSEIGFTDDIVSRFEEPFFEGGLFLNYCAMKKAGQGSYDVIIGGDGNDQIFGTGSIEVGLRHIFNHTSTNLITSAIDKYDQSTINQQYNKFYKYIFYNRKIKGLFLNDDFGFNTSERNRILTWTNKHKNAQTDSIQKDSTSLKKLFLQKTYIRDINQVANEVIIKKASVMANMFGCNIQFPYMDIDFYNFVSQLPLQYRVNGNLIDFITGKAKSKYIFKQSLKPYLPTQIYKSKKQGGFTPLSIFFDSVEKFNYIKDQIIECELFRGNEFINSFLIHCNLQIINSTSWFWYRQSLGLKLFYLLFLARWYEKVFKGKPKTIITKH